MNKVNLSEKLSMFSHHWAPHVVGELNGQYVKLAKLKGAFIWHKHDHEDELFYVISGELRLEFRDKVVNLTSGEFIIVPRGVEHRPVAEKEVAVMLFEPKGTINTGDKVNELTREDLTKI
jgi:mannose-6-phosphate isomerase-like protein (cupin superfamily)